MIIIILGAPGAGKGTQSEILQERLNMLHISSGDLLRDHRRRDTELGRIANEYMVKGELVPDDLVIQMVVDRIAIPDTERGILLDGFPRTKPQASALDLALDEKGKRVNAALYIRVDDGVLINRLSGRLTCRNCGHIYHETFAPPKVASVCDVCGGEVYQREDDKRDMAIKRLQVYFDQTRPLIEYYRERGTLCEVDGDQPLEAVTKAIIRCLS